MARQICRHSMFGGKGRPQFAGTKHPKHQQGGRKIIKRGTKTVVLEKVT